MYHGVTFLDMEEEDGMKSYEDFHLIPRRRLYIGPPEVKTNMIDIPGGDGYLDTSEAPDGRAHYGARTASWEFEIEREYRRLYPSLYSKLMNYLHNRNMRIILDDDPHYFYIGRASVNQFLSEEMAATVVIDITAQPFKYETTLSTEDWLWDPFNFETDYVRGYGRMRVDGEKTVEIPGARKPVTPTFIVEPDAGHDSMTLEFDGASYSLDPGEFKVSGIFLQSGINTMTFTGSGYVSVEFRGCSL